MSTNTTGATIFYQVSTADPAPDPTHSGSTPTGTTKVYTGPVNVVAGAEKFFSAIAYKSGMTDSTVTHYDANNTGGGQAVINPPGGSLLTQQTITTTTIFSVWDGDWALLEEYDSTGARVQGYVQGYHGLVKTLVDNIYYYQDELGSTSHIAYSSGALIESYQYDLYGKPRVYNPAGVYQPGATPQAKDLFTGQRWITEIGLYDDRNRFMSPDLGRFLQPDPIGFKGDASNLYRYCGNDWANRSDPTGLNTAVTSTTRSENAATANDNSPWTQIAQTQLAFTSYAPQAAAVERSGGNKDANSQGVTEKGMEATKKAVEAQKNDKYNRPYMVGVVKQKGTNKVTFTKAWPGVRDPATKQWKEQFGYDPSRYTLLAIGHTHPAGDYKFSDPDRRLANDLVPIKDFPEFGHGLHPIPVFLQGAHDNVIMRYTPSQNPEQSRNMQGAATDRLLYPSGKLIGKEED